MVVAAVIALPAAAMLVTAEVNPVVALQRYAAISADSRSRYKRQGELEAAIFGSRGFVDSNKDGRISDAELLAAYKIIGKSPEMVFPPLTLDDLEHIAAYYK
ncbi:MAG TPA: hypothetical protein VJB87_02795 [Candidatus Nanoarchaeia archaeon]|nr:hypothetical protein [Candidatus Nanoarchaeia archaeon]